MPIEQLGNESKLRTTVYTIDNLQASKLFLHKKKTPDPNRTKEQTEQTEQTKQTGSVWPNFLLKPEKQRKLWDNRDNMVWYNN